MGEAALNHGLRIPEIIKAWGVADDGDRNEWNIEIVLRALA